MAHNTDTVALYWDFENLHATLVDDQGGVGHYYRNRFVTQEPLVDVAAIVGYAQSLGPIAINRAFGNWVSYSRYRHKLLESAVELIQLFPPGSNAKNGADIKLSLDVADDMARFGHIGTVIVVGGDSDYIPLSHRVKAQGRSMIGIGCRNSTNPFLAQSCLRFKFYEDLVAPATPTPAGADTTVQPAVLQAAVPGPAPTETTETTEIAETTVVIEAAEITEAAETTEAAATAATTEPTQAAPLIVPAEAPATHAPAATDIAGALAPAEAPTPAPAPAPAPPVADDPAQAVRLIVASSLARMHQSRGEPWVRKAQLRPYIQRLNPTFHELLDGFGSFNNLLATMPDLVEMRQGVYDHELRLRQPADGQPA